MAPQQQYVQPADLQGAVVCREELNQPLFAAIDAFEYPELHDESIAARNFFRHLSKFMIACGVKDFGMKVSPDTAQQWGGMNTTAAAAPRDRSLQLVYQDSVTNVAGRAAHYGVKALQGFTAGHCAYAPKVARGTHSEHRRSSAYRQLPKQHLPEHSSSHARAHVPG
jgi:hypothetical protein